MKLSVIVPVYNERETLPLVLEKVKKVSYEKEIIVVDDGSSDGTRQYLESLKNTLSERDACVLKIFFHEKNTGKGAAIQTALSHVTGDIVIIQDADLEYDPQQFPTLLDPMINGSALVVYGSRFTGGGHFSSLQQKLANRILTFLTNVFYGSALTDMETCYKAVRADILKNLKLTSKRFDVEPEITSKILKKGIKIYEVPIQYAGRNSKKGKKISWKDGFSALWGILQWKWKE